MMGWDRIGCGRGRIRSERLRIGKFPKNRIASAGRDGHPQSHTKHPITMADREDKNSENVAGKFYVDSQCIDCDLCRETAPNNFARAEDEGYSYVFKQPENDEEIAQCREAMEGCPVEAIGDDGDE
jgi:ferredoxin